mgnify:CR=1 FL=1
MQNTDLKNTIYYKKKKWTKKDIKMLVKETSGEVVGIKHMPTIGIKFLVKRKLKRKKKMSNLESWGAFLALMFLVWSTDIVDWLADKIEERFKK